MWKHLHVLLRWTYFYAELLYQFKNLYFEINLKEAVKSVAIK